MLADDGALIVKFWFHLSKQAAEEAAAGTGEGQATRWRVTEAGLGALRALRPLPQHLRARAARDEHRRRAVDGGRGERWTPLPQLTAAQHAARRAAAAARRGQGDSAGAEDGRRRAAERGEANDPATRLDLDADAHQDELREQLELLQGGSCTCCAARRNDQGLSTRDRVRGLGRGGQGRRIRRLTRALDARNYRVDPHRRPDRRGARATPTCGASGATCRAPARSRSSIAPGTGACWSSASRGSAREAEWRRAYAEINEFEEQLVRHGTVLVKFWLHISKDEQLRRFKERERLAYKQLQDHRGGLAQPREVGRATGRRCTRWSSAPPRRSRRGRWWRRTPRPMPASRPCRPSATESKPPSDHQILLRALRDLRGCVVSCLGAGSARSNDPRQVDAL